jgi:tRNA A37 threonylcarbamoyladenosine synthetase subunit TsaC/SUA5/YrdC
VIDDGEGRTDLTTVIDLSEGEAEVLRVGAGVAGRVG